MSGGGVSKIRDDLLCFAASVWAASVWPGKGVEDEWQRREAFSKGDEADGGLVSEMSTEVEQGD
ncbi:hypothetical protein SLEP1_g37978 [Rubroshorea leprosula]|uniref:Uncharacterized protein n=1 Tax=Rubroshorea leprosula TaxID=152421 RepID=A0AAV5KWP8_9ROSI|nr:hypothetical protein SLEP1_g37978 [Rubroshorea leprosula]